LGLAIEMVALSKIDLDKGKLTVRWGRKVMGLTISDRQTAEDGSSRSLAFLFSGK